MKKLKLNLDQLSEELEILDFEYLRGVKGGYGDAGGGYGDYGYYTGYGGTPDDPIELDEVEVNGGYGGYGGDGGGSYNGGWPGWFPPSWPETGGDSGGYSPIGGGYGGYNDSSTIMNLVQDFFESHTADDIGNVMNAAGLANGIQTLNHSAINQLVVATGGEPITALKEVASKTGLGKICAIGAVYDGIETIVAFTDGEITNEDWESLGMTLLNTASFIPGPIGLIATGISVGIAVYDIVNN